MSSPQLSLKQAPAATLNLLLERPELAVVFWMDPDYKPPKQPGWVKFIARRLGGYTPPMELPEAPPELDRSGEVLRLDGGLDVQTNESLAPLLTGGKAIEGSTHGYGDERAVYPNEVAELDRHLSALAAENGAFKELKNYLHGTSEKSLGVVVKLS
ncbi:hypothetical protein [Botrimarina sp.]|uniref:hypothetical protein n=1 Tax=Botrimarina sp. TaxID=2795802 RepID=UPI0032EC9762